MTPRRYTPDRAASRASPWPRMTDTVTRTARRWSAPPGTV
nr:MAG TPA: hypothetical protein [Caudoviricetes sp.]